MSKKGKDRRERYQERQAKEGVKVFNWILGALAIGATLLQLWLWRQIQR